MKNTARAQGIQQGCFYFREQTGRMPKIGERVVDISIRVTTELDPVVVYRYENGRLVKSWEVRSEMIILRLRNLFRKIKRGESKFWSLSFSSKLGLGGVFTRRFVGMAIDGDKNFG